MVSFCHGFKPRLVSTWMSDQLWVGNSTQPSISPGLVNEEPLRLRRQDSVQVTL